MATARRGKGAMVSWSLPSAYGQNRKKEIAACGQLFLVDDYKMAAHKVVSLIYSRSKAEEEMRCGCGEEVLWLRGSCAEEMEW